MISDPERRKSRKEKKLKRKFRVYKKGGKEREKYLAYICGLVYGTALVMGLLSLGLTVDDYQYVKIKPQLDKELYDVRPPELCGGISYWYTNTNFSPDYLDAKEYYDENYDESEIDVDRVNPVIDLKMGMPFNCEDFSHLVMCLADLYNIECDYYYFQTFKTDMYHQGLTCFIDGKWRNYN